MSITRRTLLVLNFSLAIAFLVIGGFTVHAEREVRGITYSTLRLPVLDADTRDALQKIEDVTTLRARALVYYDLLHSERVTKYWDAVTVLEYLRYLSLLVALFFVAGGMIAITLGRREDAPRSTMTSVSG